MATLIQRRQAENERIADLILRAFMIQQRDPRDLGCTAPACRCETPCDALALPEIEDEELDALREAAADELRADTDDLSGAT